MEPKQVIRHSAFQVMLLFFVQLNLVRCAVDGPSNHDSTTTESDGSNLTEDSTQCQSADDSFVIYATCVLNLKTSGAKEVIDLLDQLSAILEDAQSNHTLHPQDIMDSMSIMEAIPTEAKRIHSLAEMEPLAQEFGRTLSTMTGEDTKDVWESFSDKKDVIEISKRILDSTFQMADTLLEISAGEDTLQSNISVVQENVDFEVRFLSVDGDGIENDLRLNGKNDSSEIYFPAKMANLSRTHRKYDKFGYYRAQYDTLADLMNMETIQDPDGTNTSVVLGSVILSATILGLKQPEVTLRDLSSPVVIVLRHQYNESLEIGKVQCVFLNMTEIEHRWSTEGCTVAKSNRSHTVCHCLHLTNFALIMDLFQMEIALVHEVALSYISYIGGSLSIVCCVLTIITYEFFRLSSERVRVHEMLAISITLMMIVFFVGFEMTSNIYVCRGFAIGLHFFLLSMFCWMLVEGIHLYVSLVKVFSRQSNIAKYCILGWGIPFIIVLISGVVFFDEYGGQERCWLSTRLLLIALIPFVSIIILVNIGVLIIVIRVMNESSKMTGKHDDILSIKAGLKATVTLTPLLGLTWVFGFLSVDDHNTLVFTYLFTICNSILGVMFFIFHCLLNSDVKSAYQRRYRRKSQSNSLRGLKSPHTPEMAEGHENSSRSGSHSDTPGPRVGLPAEADQTPTPRKRPSNFSIDSTGTNMTTVEEIMNRKLSLESDDVTWAGKNPTEMETQNIDHKLDNKDQGITESLDVFDSVISGIESSEAVYLTHL